MVRDKIRKDRKLGLTDDLVFKAVYGSDSASSKEALVALLNLILDRGDDPITDLTYKNPFVLPAVPYETKGAVMDIKVETQSHELIDIEMQVENLEGYRQRSVFYQAGLLNEGLERGEKYVRMRKAIMISFIHEEILFPETSDFHTCFRYSDLRRGLELSDVSEIHFFELKKVAVAPVSDMTPLEKFCAYMKYSANEKMEAYLAELVETGEEVIKLTENILRKVTEDERLRWEQFERDWFRRDMERMKYFAEKNGLERGMERGLQQGLEQGLAQGLEQGMEQGLEKSRLDIARKLKAKGSDTDFIAEVTGLSVKEIEAL